MGGLSKKSSLLQKLAISSDVLKIDAGTLFFDDKLSSQPQRIPQAIITASAMMNAYNYMGYDAVAIGRQDLEAGVDALQNLASKASFPFLSANLFDKKGALLFNPVAHIERAGMRIALIGLTGQANIPKTCSDTVKILPWQEVLPQIIAQIAADSDLIIILSNLTAPENRAIAKEIPNVHLIFQSGVSSQNMRPELINNTLITHAGHDGKYQGQLTIHWTAAQKWQQDDRPLLALQNEYDRLGWFIDKVRKKGGPEVLYKEDAAKIAAFSQKKARHDELAVQIKELSEGETSNPPPSATYNNHFHPLPPTLADDATIIKMLQESRKEANAVRRQTAETQKLNQYVGSSTCRSCHEAIYLAWAKTPHATSYQTLKNQDQNNNLTCVYCHVTGLDEVTAYLATSLPEPLKAVGCEVCHGPGKKHAADPSLNPSPTTPVSTLCLSCHTDERDDNFNLQHDVKKIH